MAGDLIQWWIATCGNCGTSKIITRENKPAAVHLARHDGWKESKSMSWVCPECSKKIS